MKLLALATAVVLVAVPAQAQAPTDARWAPWLGCWELVTESVRDAGDPAALPTGRGAAPSPPLDDETRPRVCATAAQEGITFTTTIAGETALEQTVIANGVDRPVEDAECQGTQRTEWSEDGLRLYSTAQLTCAADTTPRRVSGLALLGRDGTWLDIQAVEIGGREDVRLRRYRRASRTPGVAVPAVTATRLTIDDIKEASRKVSSRAIEAALVETTAAFDLTGDTLLDLDDAGVPAGVVDVMVALSYPDRFVVERTRADRGGGTVFLNDPFMLDYGFYSPLYGTAYYPYYYSPFAYSYYGRFDPRFFGGGGVILVPGDPGGGGTPEPQPTGAARAVDGHGYTRVRPRDPAAAATAGTDGQPATSSRGRVNTGSTSTSSGDASSSGSSSSGSGGVSSQGFSSGSSSGDTGRTAVPR